MSSELSPVQVGIVQSRNAAARGMVERLAQTGSGKYDEEVLTFQKVWNQAKDATNAQSLLIVGQALWYALVEDGLYGPQTSGALRLIVGDPAPPKYASGMPTWYAVNKDRVTALAPLQTVQTTEILDPWQGAPSYDAATTVSEARSGSLATDVTGSADDIGPSASSPEVAALMPPPGAEQMWCDQMSGQARLACFSERHGIIDPEGGGCFEVGWTDENGTEVYDVICENDALARGQSNIEPLPTAYQAPAVTATEVAPVDSPMSEITFFDDEGGTPVVAVPRKGDVPVLAFVLGGLALGAGLIYMGTRK